MQLYTLSTQCNKYVNTIQVLSEKQHGVMGPIFNYIQ